MDFSSEFDTVLKEHFNNGTHYSMQGSNKLKVILPIEIFNIIMQIT